MKHLFSFLIVAWLLIVSIQAILPRPFNLVSISSYFNFGKYTRVGFPERGTLEYYDVMEKSEMFRQNENACVQIYSAIQRNINRKTSAEVEQGIYDLRNRNDFSYRYFKAWKNMEKFVSKGKSVDANRLFGDLVIRAYYEGIYNIKLSAVAMSAIYAIAFNNRNHAISRVLKQYLLKADNIESECNKLFKINFMAHQYGIADALDYYSRGKAAKTSSETDTWSAISEAFENAKVPSFEEDESKSKLLPMFGK